MSYTIKQVSDSELNSFVIAVKTRFGIDFGGYEKKSLKRGISRLMLRNNQDSVMGLWGVILKNKAIIHTFIDELLVNLTEFFRNPDFWQKMRDDVLGHLIHEEQIDIWHAGCSTGEEIYSSNIMLKERLMYHKSNIIATDLSSKALDKAKKGFYHNLIWKKYIKSYKLFNPNRNPERYVQKKEDGFEIVDSLKKRVRFHQHNLVHDSMPQQFDLIYCRNVMIYFDDGLKMKTLRLFHKSLKKNGFFIIGYYDMLPEESKQLFKLYCPSTRIYKKLT